MTRYLYSFIALICLLAAVPVQAEEMHDSGLGFSKTNLVKSRYTAGRTGIEIYADRGVDVPGLLTGLDTAKSASPQAIADRINAKRKQVYPDEEIILSITPAEDAGVAGLEKAALVKAIYWWNNTNCSTCYWYAQYNSTTATMFIDDVQAGAYNIYDKVGSSGSWTFRYLVHTGEAATRATVGSLTLRGFQGSAAGAASKADVVMYFFK